MKLPAQTTLEEAAALAQALPGALAASVGTLRIDAGELRAFDSSTLALLMQARRMAQAAGLGFEVSAAPAKLTQLAELYGVQELLAFEPPAASA